MKINAYTRSMEPLTVWIDTENGPHLIVDDQETTTRVLPPEDERRADDVIDGLYDGPVFENGKIHSGSGRIRAWEPAWLVLHLYESWGVLGREKIPVYTYGRPASEHYNEIDVIIPEGVEITENEAGEKLVDLDGGTYLLNDALNQSGGKPCLMWWDGRKHHHFMLEVIK